MTFQVRKSLLSSTDLFDVEVAAFAHELRNWRAHMTRVERDRKNGVQGIERHDPHPAPTAHPLIMAAVNDETAEPDYVFVEDPLDERKAKLADHVLTAASEALNLIASPAKLRAAQLRVSDIGRDDVERISKVMEKHSGLLQKLKIKSIDHRAVAADVAALRSDSDNALLAETSERNKAIDSIHRKMINAHSEIEDLTEETVRGYQIPKF